jgi:hypothetical protein
VYFQRAFYNISLNAQFTGGVSSSLDHGRSRILCWTEIVHVSNSSIFIMFTSNVNIADAIG